ncbi:MAG: methyltransferase, partial [Azonexus sp.]
MISTPHPIIHWPEAGAEQAARWRSEAALPAPSAIEIANDRTSADAAYRLMEAGTALLWRGDWVNARHLMEALSKRADRRFGAGRGKPAKTAAEAFAQHRQTQGERAALLARLLVPVAGDFSVPLRRA